MDDTAIIQTMNAGFYRVEKRIDGVNSEFKNWCDKHEKAHAAALAESKKPNSVIPLSPKKLREWFIVAAIIAAAVLSVWTKWTTPTSEEMTEVVEQQTQPVAEIAATLKRAISIVEAMPTAPSSASGVYE